MKTILVDAINGLVLEDGSILEPMHKLLESYPNNKIVLTGANDEQFKHFKLDQVPYEVFTLKHNPEKTDPQYYKILFDKYGLTAEDVVYFEHNAEAAKTAESVGITTYFYDHTKQDMDALKQFLDENQQTNSQSAPLDNTSGGAQVIQPATNSKSPQQTTTQLQTGSPFALQSPVQPGTINGQSFTPTMPMSSSQLEEISEQKSWAWLYAFIALSVLFTIAALVFLAYMMIKKQWDRFFIALGILQVLGVILFFGVMASIAGQTGGEFIALILFVTLVPAVGLVALINLIGLPIYIRKHKLHGKGLVFGILSLVISLVLALYGAWSVYQMRVVVPKHINELSKQTDQRARKYAEESAQRTKVSSPKPGKTKEEAISFMQSCKADYFVGYTDINLVKDSNTKSWLNAAEQSSTGIEILEGSPKSYVFTSKAMTTALQDNARQFRQSCYNTKKLYITVDNWIETEYPAGKWTRVNQ